MEVEVPKNWYNIIPDLPRPVPPPRDPPGAEFSRIELLLRILPREVIRLETSVERFVKIPEEVREALEELGRPTPLLRARRLEEKLRTPARIYYKYEGVLPTGSHKVNTAVAQAFYAAEEGVEGLSTETGAGQWGSALALGAAMYGLKALVFMVRCSYYQKPYRRVLMKLYGADVVPSPSGLTETGRRVLREDPDSPGSLGVAISEAIEYALEKGWRYAIGSVFNAVLVHQSVIGLEAKAQMELLGEGPDVVVGCVGGGSNFAGLAYPFIGEELAKGRVERRYVAVTPREVPKFTRGQYKYDYPDKACMLPLIKMHSLGKDFTPPPIYSGGLRYHGVAPTLSILVEEGLVEPREYEQDEVFAAAKLFAETEGFLPAPETAHAVKAVIDEALEARRKGEERVILFCFSGHGLLDLSSYEAYV